MTILQKGPAVKQLGHWIATLESAIQQTTGAKLELVKVGGIGEGLGKRGKHAHENVVEWQ